MSPTTPAAPRSARTVVTLTLRTLVVGTFVLALVVTGVVVAPAAVAGPSEGLAGQPTTAADLGYVPVAPARLLDTRVAGGKPVGPGARLDVQVVGVKGIPSNARAVALNVTGTQATARTFLRIWPSGAAMPATSFSNIDPWTTDALAAGVVSGVGSDGKVSLYNNTGSIHLVVDVTGYFVEAGGYGFGLAASGVRVYDSRNGFSSAAGSTTTKGPLLSGQPRSVQVGGVGTIPKDAVAVVANVTSVGPRSVGNIAAYPAGGQRPETSSVNHIPGDNVSNRTTVPLDAQGRMALTLTGASADVVVDVVGWYGPGQGLRFTPIVPERAVDTRTAGYAAVAAGQPRSAQLSTASVPSDAVAVLVSVAATQQTARTYVTVWGSGPKPATSDLNTAPGRDQAAMTVVRVDQNAEILYVDAGRSHLVVDTLGYFRGNAAAGQSATSGSNAIAPDTKAGPGGQLTVWVAPRGTGTGLTQGSPVGDLAAAQRVVASNGGKAVNVDVRFLPGTYTLPTSSWSAVSPGNRVRFLPAGYRDGAGACPVDSPVFVGDGTNLYWMGISAVDSDTRYDVRCMTVRNYTNGINITGGYEYKEPGRDARGKGARMPSPTVTGMVFDRIGNQYVKHPLGTGWGAVHILNTDKAVVWGNTFTDMRNVAPDTGLIHAVYMVYSTNMDVRLNRVDGDTGDAIRVRSSSTGTVSSNVVNGAPKAVSDWWCDAACGAKNAQSTEYPSAITVR